MRHLIDPLDFTREETDRLLELAGAILDNPSEYAHRCAGKILATLFFEPSTRTRLSFESAMLRLGGQVLGFSNAQSSSAAKGESVADTIRMISGYADITAMRHFKEGAPFVASQYARIPVINAGDGGHQHPTQTLTDLLTIRRLKGRLDHLTVGLCGDLKYGRTVHSLITAMCRYKGIRFILVSPEELRLPDHDLQALREGGFDFVENSSLEETIGEMDVLYMTRIQGERFADKAQYERLKDSYILDMAKMALAKKDMIVLHPLPRVNEIAVEVDADPRARYFDQVLFGKYVRMALILKLLGLSDHHFTEREVPGPLADAQSVPGLHCRNERCITVAEPSQAPLFRTVDGRHVCAYCDHAAD